MNFDKNILITGGMGFIGSHLVRHFVNYYKNYNIINLDALTYASNKANLLDIETANNYVFVEANILDTKLLSRVFDKYKITDVIHLAAETHVDNSILDPNNFLNTNVLGTVNLLNTFLDFSSRKISKGIFYQISTDEVYGSLLEDDFFVEETPYNPNSPYSASKASADHFVRAYGETYGLKYMISNCSNNYGPNQSIEKFIPVIINSIIENNNIPIYGDGDYTRDWLFVMDHIEAIDIVFHKGKVRDTYNIGGDNQMKNIDLVRYICDRMDAKLSRNKGESSKLISFVEDRPGHDKRYAIDCQKIKNQLNWKRKYSFRQSIDKTIDWYMDNKEWIDTCKKYRKN